jgi:hypothetical protein
MHHLQQLSSALRDIDARPPGRARYNALQERYAAAASEFDALIAAVPSIAPRDKGIWNTAPSSVLDAYGAGEGF